MKHRFIHARLCRFLAASQLQVKTGVEALLFLGNHPGQIFKPLELSIRLDLHAEDPELLLAKLDAAFTNVPYCDARALAQYQQRIRQLNRVREELLQTAPHADCADIDWELAFLRAEIRRNTRPRGGIKHHNSARKHAYLRLKVPLSRLIHRAARRDPELASYIRLHLRTNHGFAWYGERIVLPQSEPHQTELPLAA